MHSDRDGKQIVVGTQVFVKPPSGCEMYAEVIELLDGGDVRISDFNGPSIIVAADRCEVQA
jgi:hypothetical protein